MIYLDHNATTPVRPQVVESMLPWLTTHFGNPSSAHPFGQRTRDAVERARGQVATLLGCVPQEVLFTSGGTESNNLAIRGVAAARPRGRHAVTSVVEHPAVHGPLEVLRQSGWVVERIGVDAHGQIDADEVVAALRPDTALITVMHANNVVGTLQPVAAIGAARGAVVLHTDAAQSVGKIPVDVSTLGVDLLTVAGHKLGGPKGVGALFVRDGTALSPLLRGAGHERGLRPGTENVASIVGLGEACALAHGDLAETEARLRRQCARMLAGLQREIGDLVLNGHPTDRLPNTLNVQFPGVRGSAVLAAAPELAASTGSACHDHGEEPSAVLLTMGRPGDEALGAVRLSLGHETTDDEVETTIAALVRAWRAARRR